MDTKPAIVRQLVDKTARQLEKVAFKNVKKFSECNTLTPAAVAEAGADAKNSQVVISLNTVAYQRIGRLCGQTKNNTMNANDAPSPDIKVGIIGLKSEWDDLHRIMFHAGAIESLRSLFEQHQEPVRPSTNAALKRLTRTMRRRRSLEGESTESSYQAWFSCYNSDSAFTS